MLFVEDKAVARKEVRIPVGVIGYGPAFNMGKHHLNAMAAYKEFVPTAVCDRDTERLKVARADFPGIQTYTSVSQMLRKSEVQLVAILLPHHLHAKVAIACLNAGRHVVVEKPFAITVEECDAMIAAARRHQVMLSAYHNRHWDANIITIMKHLPKIGRPFRWESFQGGYSEPGSWWRSDKKMSGGVIYDWGAHFVEWMLQVMNYEMEAISGFQIRKEVWKQVTNEDEVEALVRFRGDAIASHTASTIAMAGKDTIRITGTKGAIVAGHGSVVVHTLDRQGNRVATTVKMERAAHHRYYENVRDHLVEGKPLIITPEWARRVIQVLDYACRSAARGGVWLKPKYR